MTRAHVRLGRAARVARQARARERDEFYGTEEGLASRAQRAALHVGRGRKAS